MRAPAPAPNGSGKDSQRFVSLRDDLWRLAPEWRRYGIWRGGHPRPGNARPIGSRPTGPAGSKETGDQETCAQAEEALGRRVLYRQCVADPQGFQIPKPAEWTKVAAP